jgi:pyrimidine operon attenuation protein/uracil phosphoribosyltransferase
MDDQKVILEGGRFKLAVDRICYQLIESYDDFQDACLVGIQPRGTLLANRIHQRLLEITKVSKIEYGKLDITFFRDDFRTSEKPLLPHSNEFDFLVDNKKVILIDDVLYTGRTIQAAMTALNHYGRPAIVELVVMVDRRFNRHLPIQPDFLGIAVDAVDQAYVKVLWEEDFAQAKVILYATKNNSTVVHE